MAVPSVHAGLRIAAHGQKNVSSAGTAEILFTAATTVSVLIKAKSGNTNNVYVGTSAVSSSNGLILEPGETVIIDVNHKESNIYIDVDTDNEGVSYIALST